MVEVGGAEQATMTPHAHEEGGAEKQETVAVSKHACTPMFQPCTTHVIMPRSTTMPLISMKPPSMYQWRLKVPSVLRTMTLVVPMVASTWRAWR